MKTQRENSIPSLMQVATGLLALSATVSGAATGTQRRRAGRRHLPRHVRPKPLDTPAPTACENSATHPKVALMFLSRGGLPHEQAWLTWLKTAEGLHPKAPNGTESCHLPPPVPVTCPPQVPADAIAAQDLFNVYVHAAPGYLFEHTSLFGKHQVTDRVSASWGQHALIDAERSLVRTALEDPRNARFVLLSESGIPLYPADTIYQQLVHEDKSRVNACFYEGSDAWRWHPGMQQGPHGIAQTGWRKSPQWFTLIRKHAEVFANDKAVDAVFREFCAHREYDPYLGQAFHCYSDEHYLPVLLSHLDLGHETDCVGASVNADWSRGGASPRTYAPHDISQSLFRQLRGDNCQAQMAIDMAPAMFDSRARSALPCEPAPPWDAAWLHAKCPLFARKFGPETQSVITDMMTDCDNDLELTRC